MRGFLIPTRRLLSASHSAPVKETVKDKLKAELKKMIKIQLFLIPVACVIVFWLFPPPSPEEEKRLRIEYEKNAGWKT